MLPESILMSRATYRQDESFSSKVCAMFDLTQRLVLIVILSDSHIALQVDICALCQGTLS